MNWDRVQGNWKQFTGKVKEQWGQLTDDDLTQNQWQPRTARGQNTGPLWLRQRPSEEGRGRLVEPVVTFSQWRGSKIGPRHRFGHSPRGFVGRSDLVAL